MAINVYQLLFETYLEYFPNLTQTEIAKSLRVTPSAITHILSGSVPLKKSTIKAKIRQLFDLYSVNLIRPIFEFQEFEPVLLRSNYAIHPARLKKDSTDDEKRKFEKIKKKWDVLKEYNGAPVKGIYIFYNSQGKVLYVGKTQKGIKRTLFNEVTNQLNRKIAYFATTNHRIVKKTIKQAECVHYISAYQINSIDAIHNIEALLIRSYANDNTNIQMAQFKSKLTKSKKRK